jgi:hypothetical protein
MESGFNDTMHATLSVVFGVLLIAAMALSAVAYPGWFRVYSLATIAVVVGFGLASSRDSGHRAGRHALGRRLRAD